MEAKAAAGEQVSHRMRSFRTQIAHLHRALGRGGRPTASVHPFDLEFGVETSGMVPASRLVTGHVHDRHNTAYYAIAPSLFRGLCQSWQETALPFPAESYTFIDMGAGKGRAMLLASELGFSQVLGVEIHPKLCRAACRNLKRWSRLGRAAAPMRVLCEDATAFQFPASPCVLYLFHPFDGVVLARLIQRIEEAFEQRPGELDLLYVNAEFDGLLEQHAGFARLWSRSVPMSAEDAAFDRLIESSDSAIQYGVTGDEICSAWRWVGRAEAPACCLPCETRTAEF